MYVSIEWVFKIWPFKIFHLSMFCLFMFLQNKMKQIPVRNNLCMCTHTHVHNLNMKSHVHTWTCKQYSHHAYKTEQERKFKYNAKHLRRNISNIGSLKEKSNLGLRVGKKFITSKAKRTQHLSKFPWLQGQSQEGKTKVMSGAVKFVFPSSNVSAHWSLNLSHSLLKQMPQSVPDTALLIKCTRVAFSGRMFFQIK